MAVPVQVCWEKFCRYFDVERRIVYAEEGRYSATPELMEPLIDENTIGEGIILCQHVLCGNIDCKHKQASQPARRAYTAVAMQTLKHWLRWMELPCNGIA